MPRGEVSPVGTEKVSQNGYVYVKTGQGWRLKHVLIAERKLKRPLEADERAYFKDRDRTNFSAKNIEVRPVMKKQPALTSIQKIKTQLEKTEAEFNEKVLALRKAIEQLESQLTL